VPDRSTRARRSYKLLLIYREESDVIELSPERTVALAEREVRSATREGAPTRTTVVRRRFATDVDDLWEAVTDRDRLARWFLPVTGDLELGGRYQFEGNAGGVVETCEPPRGFSATWEFADQVSWVRVHLSPDGEGRTVLQLEHEAPVDDPSFWETYGPGAAGIGWDLGLLGLGLHLGSDGAPVDPEAAQVWTLSDEGVAFVRAAALDWAAAAIDDGDDGEAAQQAAERTIAFYTVAPS
jgi:uncharacterized protein YndB with AHSA1/START domain